MPKETIQGRIYRIRAHKNIVFYDIRSANGIYQAALQRNSFGEDYDKARRKLGMGNIVTVGGDYFISRTSMKTLDIKEYNILSKCYSPEKIKIRPNLFTRRKRRGLDLLTSKISLQKFRRASLVGQVIRYFLYDRDFIEVDTGILKDSTDTSKAQDFTTYAQWSGKELFLRKSTEQRLKQLMVGGLENIFELGKVFRNEDITRDFSPEFTALELYMGYANYQDLLLLVKDILHELDSKIGIPRTKPSSFEEIPFYEFIKQKIKKDSKQMNIDELNSFVSKEKRKDYPNKEESRGYILHNLFEGLIKEEKKRNVTVIGYPRQITVLSKTFDEDPDLAEEFRMFVRGRSYCYGCTELTDYKEQERRIQEQANFWRKPQDELDEGFIEMLRIGLPPCAGLGLSLERLVAIYLDQKNLNDIILFPL